MAKRKRKITEMTEKKNKKLKKASAKEMPPAATPGTGEAHAEVGARGVPVQREGAARAGWVTSLRAAGLLGAAVRQVRGWVNFGFERRDRLSSGTASTNRRWGAVLSGALVSETGGGGTARAALSGMGGVPCTQ